MIAREATERSDLVQMAVWEREISLLSSQDYALYESLRESGRIQARLRRFTLRMRSTSPLHPEQERVLLIAKR